MIIIANADGELKVKITYGLSLVNAKKNLDNVRERGNVADTYQSSGKEIFLLFVEDQM
jgi:hypothetical protein